MVVMPECRSGLPPTELSLLVPPCPLPAGHYYLVLNEPLDMIPLMAYLALRGTRTVCYLPENTVWNAYQQLVSFSFCVIDVLIVSSFTVLLV